MDEAGSRRKQSSRVALLFASLLFAPLIFCISLISLYCLETWSIEFFFLLGPKCNLFDKSECFAIGDVSLSLGSYQLNHSIKYSTGVSKKATDDEIFCLSISNSTADLDAKSANPRIAFLFLTRGPLPLEKLWMRFFEGHEEKFSIYVHSSDPSYAYNASSMSSSLFIGRNIPSKTVTWGSMNVVAAERRLLAWALMDPQNQFFVLVSESCIPIYDFSYVYNFLMKSEQSFLESFHDVGPHGTGRYLEGMNPEVTKREFQKGSQWFGFHRRHAMAAVADNLYYNKFVKYCKPGEGNRNCYGDEHYFQTFFHMMDAEGLTNFTMTYVDWSEKSWHPRTFVAQDVTDDLILRVKKAEAVERWNSGLGLTDHDCLWNGKRRPCYVFARKFDPSALHALMNLPQDVLGY